MNRLLAAILTLVGCTSSSGSAPSRVTPQEAAGLQRNDFAVLVDVREADEIEHGMAQGALWMPTSKIEPSNPDWQAFIKKLPHDKQIVFYCKAGGRAGKAAKLLSTEGFKTANMGGFDDWKSAGLPVKKPGG
ncbi:MAG: rhodanese-like domain-containing protein [Bdellovibrionota bacterium]